MQKAIIFDWSGTLLDSFSCFLEVCELMFKELGREMPDNNEIKKTFTSPYMKFWNHYFPNLTKERQDKLYEMFIHQVREPKTFSLVKETLVVLESKGYMLFVVSSDPLSKLLPQVERAGIKELLVEVRGFAHDKTEVLKDLGKKHDLSMEQSYYIGDTEGDVFMGKSAGLKTVGVTWGFQDKKKLQASQPDYLLDSIEELQNIL